MAYTSDDLRDVRRAIVDLSTGKQITRITKDGRSVEYASADLEKLRQLERHIADVVASANPGRHRRTRTRYVTTSKGL